MPLITARSRMRESGSRMIPTDRQTNTISYDLKSLLTHESRGLQDGQTDQQTKHKFVWFKVFHGWVRRLLGTTGWPMDKQTNTISYEIEIFSHGWIQRPPSTNEWTDRPTDRQTNTISYELKCFFLSRMSPIATITDKWTNGWTDGQTQSLMNWKRQREERLYKRKRT